MPQVFISHAVAADGAFVQEELLPICSGLQLECWTSEESVEFGARFSPKIADALARADVIIVVASKAAIARDHVKDEVEWAMSHRREDVIVLDIDGCEPDDLCFGLSNTRYIDYRPHECAAGRAALISALVRKFHNPTPLWKLHNATPLSGSWTSVWETRARTGDQWVAETLEIKLDCGVHVMDAKGLNGLYEWHGEGRFFTDTVFVFPWKITKPEGAQWAGVGTVYRNTDGRYLVGHWYGPNDRGDAIIGKWIITREGTDPLGVAADWFDEPTAQSLREFLQRFAVPGIAKRSTP